MPQHQGEQFHHGNLRQVLVDTSLAILDRDGADAITIREVARRAGVSHAAPVNHFATRRILLTEVAAQLFRELQLTLTKAIACSGPGPADHVMVFAKCLIQFGLEKPNRYQMLWRWDLVDQHDPVLSAVMEEIYAALVGLIDRSWPKSKFEAATIATTIWSAAHGYLSLRLGGVFEPAQDTALGMRREDAILTMLIEGLRTPAE